LPGPERRIFLAIEPCTESVPHTLTFSVNPLDCVPKPIDLGFKPYSSTFGHGPSTVIAFRWIHLPFTNEWISRRRRGAQHNEHHHYCESHDRQRYYGSRLWHKGHSSRSSLYLRLRPQSFGDQRSEIRDAAVKSALLWLIIAAALVVGLMMFPSRRSGQLNVEPHAAEEIEKAKRAY
jgi:hypothetical protein